MTSGKAVKIVVLGAAGVGKTCLIRSLLNEPLPTAYEPTDDNWYSGHVTGSDGRTHRVQFLDTGGYDSFPELVRCYVKTSAIFLVVTQQGCIKSTVCAQRIVKDVRKCRGSVPILCALTKCDAELIDGCTRVLDCTADQFVVCSSYLNIGISEVKDFLVRALSRCAPAAPPPTGSKASVSRAVFSAFGAKPAKEKVKPAKPRPEVKVKISKPPLIRKSSSHPDLRSCGGGAKTISAWHALTGSSRKLSHMSPSSSATSDQLSDIYRKYGYERKLNPSLPAVHSSTSVGNLASNIRSSTSSLVKSVQETLSKLATA